MITFRPATKQDASFLFPLIVESSGGVYLAIWRALSENDESIEDTAITYFTDAKNNLNIENTVLIELDGIRMGAMICYQEKEEQESQGDTTEPAKENSPLPLELTNALQPYRELSDPNSFFISELCLVKEARGQGLGTQLLEYAKETAKKQNFSNITLRVFSENVGAIRLYERFGFQFVDELPLIPHPEITMTGSILLMSYPI